jgi:hypothetical protein
MGNFWLKGTVILTCLMKLRVTGDIETLSIRPLTEALEMMGLPTALPSENTTENFSLTKTLALIMLHLRRCEPLLAMNIIIHPRNNSRLILLVRYCTYLNTFRVVRLQHNTTQHSTTQHNTAQHNTAQHSTAQHNTAQHNTAQHNTTQHNTAQHNTTQHITTQHVDRVSTCS